VRPTPALMAGSVARRAIEEMVGRQATEVPPEVPPGAAN